MISSLRQLRFDASIILLLIIGVCAAGGFFFAFYETEETDRPLAVVRHVPRDADETKPILATEKKAVIPATAPNSIVRSRPSPNEKSEKDEQARSQEDR